MRYLGIDYGSKRVGIAISDEGNTVAFPKIVLRSGAGLLKEVSSIAEEEGVGAVIVGESKDSEGGDNPIMDRIHRFKEELERELNLPVIFEPEFFTTVQAERQGTTEMLDASAAAIILQSYLDKINAQKK